MSSTQKIRVPTEWDARWFSSILNKLGGSGPVPVGEVFIALNNTDPAQTLGYGTWQLIASGIAVYEPV